MSEDNPTRMLVLKIKAIKKAIPEKKKKLNDQIASIRSQMKLKITNLENEKSGLEVDAMREMAKVIREFEKNFRFDRETEALFTKFRPEEKWGSPTITIATSDTQFNVVLREDGHWHVDLAWSASDCENTRRSESIDDCLKGLIIDLRLLDKFLNDSLAEKAKYLE